MQLYLTYSDFMDTLALLRLLNTKFTNCLSEKFEEAKNQSNDGDLQSKCPV